MEERRSAARQRTFKTGTISFNRAGGISCTIRNVSDRGACLEVASPVGIPDQFTLVLDSDQSQRSCLVSWRSAKRIGVSFRTAA